VSSSLPNTVRNLFSRRGPKQAAPVHTLQRALEGAESPASGLDQLLEALDAVLQGRLWEMANEQFGSFAEFAIAPAPSGLGASTLSALKLLRHLLLERGHYGTWLDLMERTMHKRGRPAKNLANGEVFGPVYPYPRTRNSRDHMLLTLKRHHPDTFASLCEAKGSIRQAAIKAGVIASQGEQALRYNVYDVQAARQLRETAKPKLLKELFDDLGLDAQCTFLKGLESVLGRDLARTWREQSTRLQ
jgi:hypothetical protein